MPERLFLFIQLELPWELGPPDGRYLLRARGASGMAGISEIDGAQPERVVVLSTLGASRRAELRLGRTNRRRARPRATTPESTPVAIARATIVDPVSLSAERQAHAWLADLDAERETRAAVAVLNRVLFAHRIASADPHVHEISPAQALVIRAGWGEGEQVADGHWLHALELPWRPSSRARRRVAALRPQERLAELLGARGEELLCEELALRARLDLDHGRLHHATIELDGALTAALSELNDEQRPDLAPRVAELEALRPGVTPEEPHEEVVRYALERLEAALRARTAAGFATAS
ncbi:MAG TPA: hypothetical protein VMU55_09310 [Solirubrobacteraceae bacterium]|nr:hypothetical protein [Solirubrobacteraceae bacterium]